MIAQGRTYPNKPHISNFFGKLWASYMLNSPEFKDFNKAMNRRRRKKQLIRTSVLLSMPFIFIYILYKLFA